MSLLFGPSALPRLRLYMVSGCPNEEENETLCCPFDGCDGIRLYTMEECLMHDHQIHHGPYICVHCNFTAVSQLGLSRHAEQRHHHQPLVCHHSGCPYESAGARVTSQRKGKHSAGEELSTQSGTESEEAGEGHRDTTPEDQNLNGKGHDELGCSGFEGAQCLGLYCKDYEKYFASQNAVERHVASLGHVRAAALRKRAEDSHMSDKELEEYQRACRKLTCFKKDCASFGWVYKTTAGFFYHLDSVTHNYSAKPSAKPQHTEPAKPGRKRWNFTLHASSAPHVKAVQRGAEPWKESGSDGTAQPQTGLVGCALDRKDAESATKINALEGRVQRLEEELVRLRHIKWWLSAGL